MKWSSCGSVSLEISRKKRLPAACRFRTTERLWVCLALVLFPSLLGSIGCSMRKNTEVTGMDNIIEAMHQLHVGLPDKLISPPLDLSTAILKANVRFDPNDYFRVLPHLKISADHILDYVYYWNGGTVGYPVLYVRKRNQVAFQDYAQYEAKSGTTNRAQLLYRYMESINVDDTAEGYLQFIILRTMGGRFCVLSSGGEQIIGSESALRRHLDLLGRYGRPPTPEERTRTLARNANPLITFYRDRVVIELLVFYDLQAILRKSYAVDRRFPHIVMKEHSEVVWLQ